MASTTRIASPIYSFFPNDVEGFDSLAELALDMRWSWNHSADEVWDQLDHELWELTQNPWVVLQTVSRDRLRQALADPEFCKKADDLVRAKHLETTSPAWFQKSYPNSSLTAVAYFSMEFMLSEALPIYSGGLGNVAGDQLKAASDLGIPVVGIGLLYQQGYFRQVIDRDGAQEALFPYNDPGQLPVTPLREPNGEWLRLEIRLPGYSVWLRAWQVQVGRVRLYLLDSNDAANYPAHRGITSELYGGGPEVRLKQEILLGIGGWRLLHCLKIRPEVCHLNEGHAAFAILERARAYMEETGHPFDVALAVTRPGNLFTTHTPVEAGFDRFAPALIEQYLGRYAEADLGLSVGDLLGLGRMDPSDRGEPFNMTYLGLRGSGAVNVVSRLHGQVSRRIFSRLFPRWPEEEVPIGSVTNGVHMSTWDSAVADELWTRSCSKGRWLETGENLEEKMICVEDDAFWRLRAQARSSLVAYLRERVARQLEGSGATPQEIDQAGHLFDPAALTLGFARRFATYKRPNLLLHDPERLARLLRDPKRPVQLIVAGKAHPADRPGQALIRQWTNFARRAETRPHVVFLEDYDMRLTGRLVQGVDLWINTPRRPWEACGTSGMKVLVNGGLNISELDGWWAEAYTPDVGWALGDGREHGDDPAWDAAEATHLYSLLEQEVIPQFYERDLKGIPRAWVSRIRESMGRLTPRFSATRAVREYTEKYYLPGSVAYKGRRSNSGAIGATVTARRGELGRKWPALRFGEVNVSKGDGSYLFHVQVYLGALNADAVSVELYAEGIDERGPVRKPMRRAEALVGATGFLYEAEVPATRPDTDYTARVIPRLPDASIPLECAHILWQR
jgi:glycogen phosphorylase